MGPQTSRAQVGNDEQAIREMVERWLAASKKGDLATVLSLMADDVIFMVPGKEPFGKETFAANSEQMNDINIEGISEIHELKVLGDWAWMRTHLKVTFTPPNGKQRNVRATHSQFCTSSRTAPGSLPVTQIF
jgi:uncharacterized protein (TIGR02246 family)